jgi:carbon-monoxide dehydrogenase large subunit
MRAAAARTFACEPPEVSIAGEMVGGPGGQSLAWSAFAGISVEGTYASAKRTYSYGAHAAHVAVDPGTGHVGLVDYVAVEDVGRIVNPLTLHGQCTGAIVQGLGGALLEQLIHDENGQLLTGSLADYLMPNADDFPQIRAFALELKPAPHNPLGAKGAGEGGIIPVGGVIANAVANALSSFGVEPRVLPLSPSRVWEMIEEAKAVAKNPVSFRGASVSERTRNP